MSDPRDHPKRALDGDADDDALVVSPSRTSKPTRSPHSRRRRKRGRTGLSHSIALTALSTVIPGAGLLGARTYFARWVGLLTSLLFIGTIAAMGWLAFSNFGSFAGFSVSPAKLRRLSRILPLIGLVWVALITITHLATRPRNLSPRRRATGAVMVTIFSLIVAAPVAVASRYSVDQQMLVEKVFQNEDEVTSTSRPTIDSSQPDPWQDHPRLNVLLLGGDSNDARDEEWGVRTDTIMVASVDTRTGRTTIIQIPRNVQFTPFPRGSTMREIYPDGFRGEGDPQQWFINTLWDTVERDDHPELFRGSTYRGAEALKEGVEGITGLDIDYFVMLNIDGIQRLIDAMGGVTVNINERLPRGGDSKGRKPNGYLEPGPNQHLGGYDAMWYARSRSDSDDYSRMARQSCLIGAMIKQASPKTMLTSYEAIAAASADMLVTDVPKEVLEPLLSLSLKVKDADIERLVFSPGKNGYDWADPDFVQMRRAVRNAINPPPPPTATPSTPVQTSSPSPLPSSSVTEDGTEEVEDSTPPTLVDGAQSVTDACAYNPE